MKILITLLAAVLMAACAAEEIDPNKIVKTVTLEKPRADESHYSYVPFEVPAGTTSLSLSYEYDKRDGKNRIELGLFDSRFSGKDSDKAGFRGWSGAVRERVFVAKDSASHGYEPGEIQPGTWYVILGRLAVEDPGVEVTIRIDLNEVDSEAKQAYSKEKARGFSHKTYEKFERLKTGELTWYAGDLHSHSYHSDGTWSVKGILDSASANHLDFVSITAHNTFTHQAEIEDLSEKYPNMLILGGQEVTTYGGHINVWGLSNGSWVDFRVLPFEEESAKRIAAEAEKLGGMASLNHPMMECGGCNWAYGKWENMPAVEIWNAVWDEQDEEALERWDELQLNYKRITGIGSSDSHQHPDEPSDYGTNRAIGSPTVFVGAKANTKEAIFEGIRNGKVFVAENSRRRMMLTADGKATIGDIVEAKYGDLIEFKYSLEGFENGSKFRLIANAQVAKEFLIYEENHQGVYKIYAHQDGFVRLEVRDHRDQLIGFSNPIHFRVKQQ